MTWFSSGMIFIMVWWLIFFMVLPIGARSYHEAGEIVEKGNAESAPIRPRLWLKAIIATLLALLMTVLIYFIIDLGALSFRP